VQITGGLDDAEKALLELDIFLLCSGYEPWSYSLMEAMPSLCVERRYGLQ
jgi:hypothetical protein